MTPGQYNACLSLFFVSYAGFEPLTNILLKRLKPSVFIPAIMALWGVVMVCMGLVHNFSGLAAARFFLGVAEAGLFPGVTYYLSTWYKRSEIGIRTAIFFSAAAIAGSFGGLLAAAIAKMDGIGGKHGWAWIFILVRFQSPAELIALHTDSCTGRSGHCLYRHRQLLDGPRFSR